MSKSLVDIEKEVLALPLRERALLVERLLATLDRGEDVDVEELWIAEAERRYQEYRAGRIGARPADQVFEQAKNRINRL